jgi:2-polyprenyl-6-methoxyphenol hydroxylase-like FAD-dependent oxidoreductase
LVLLDQVDQVDQVEPRPVAKAGGARNRHRRDGGRREIRQCPLLSRLLGGHEAGRSQPVVERDEQVGSQAPHAMDIPPAEVDPVQAGALGVEVQPVQGRHEEIAPRDVFGFRSEPLGHDLRGNDALRHLVVDKLASLSWEGTRLAKAARDVPDFSCDAMAQIRMDHWSRGRVALLGDAGYCPSPLSGQGTSLAPAGACVLADCLAQAPGDHHAAFSRYEQRMRPFVSLNQALITENPGGPTAEASVAHAKNALSLDG